MKKLGGGGGGVKILPGAHFYKKEYLITVYWNGFIFIRIVENFRESLIIEPKCCIMCNFSSYLAFCRVNN